MSSAEYAPVARGALKLKGIPQVSKSHRKKRAKPEPSSTAHADSKDGGRETTNNDKLERQIRSRSQDRDDQEYEDRKEEEQRDSDMGGERERESEGEINPKEQEEIPISRGKTAAEMRHDERRKRKVWILPPCPPLRSAALLFGFRSVFAALGETGFFPPSLSTLRKYPLVFAFPDLLFWKNPS